MRLFLVRHGRTPSNVALLLDTAAPGAELDEEGHRQAAALVERLAEEVVDAVFISDLIRTAQTAAPLAGARKLEPTALVGLREISAGEDEMSAEWRRYVSTLRAWGTGDLAARIPGGEDAAEFHERFSGAIRQIASTGHGAALLVSHGAAIRAWCGHNLPGFAALLGDRGLPNTTVVVIEGSPDDGWELVRLDYPPEVD